MLHSYLISTAKGVPFRGCGPYIICNPVMYIQHAHNLEVDIFRQCV